MDIRDQRDDDASEVSDMITAAFADDGRVAALAHALRARTDTQVGLVAVGNRQIVGHTHLSISWIDAPQRLIEVLTLSPLAVAPDHQGQGIGARLLAQAAQRAERLGCPLLFLEGDPRFYSRRGWVAAGTLGFSPPSHRIPDPAFQAKPLATYDRETMVGRLVYNDTFWARDCVGLREDS